MANETSSNNDQHFPNVHLLPQTPQLRVLHTIIRDKSAKRIDFVVASQRIIRMLIESGLSLLPLERCQVQTPVGRTYNGLRFVGDLCGVSVVRAGDSMESVFREIEPSARIGKILIQRDKTTKLPKLYYSSLPDELPSSQILLFEPMLATGGSGIAAIKVLLDHGAKADQIILINLLTVPEGIAAVQERFPEVRIVTSAIDDCLSGDAFMLPGIGDFGDRFFGTDG